MVDFDYSPSSSLADMTSWGNFDSMVSCTVPGKYELYTLVNMLTLLSPGHIRLWSARGVAQQWRDIRVFIELQLADECAASKAIHNSSTNRVHAIINNTLLGVLESIVVEEQRPSETLILCMHDL
jgi:hypothetical protein